MTSSATMSMSSMTMTNSGAATTTAASSGGHDMSSMSSGSDVTCKISMLWNWTTIDACFLSSSWHISSNGAFAVSCIGVALLVVVLEALRRLGKEYDSHMLRQFQRNAIAQSRSMKVVDGIDSGVSSPQYMNFRPTPLQQLIRSVIHMATFGVAYIIMLLAMYFNGYIIISIFSGALLGKFVCDWATIKVPINSTSGTGGNRMVEEPTVCCG